VCLDAGTFTFKTELSIDVDDVTLRGAGRDQTILDFSAQDTGGNGMIVKGDRVTLEDFRVKNTPGDGIRGDSVEDIVYRRVWVSWDAVESLSNGAYGLYPVNSKGVTIDACIVNGARDAGIYVGQSTDILVKDSEAYGNVAGIEIENSTDAEVVNNHAHDNTGGILVFNLPGLPVKDGKRANVHHNLVENNNVPNFGDPGSTVGKVPSGLGLMILASDDNELHHNEVEGNASLGVVIVSYTNLLFPPVDDPEYDVFPQGNYVHDNTFDGNGESPDGLIEAAVSAAPVPAIAWDGCEDSAATDDGHLVNCVGDNGGAGYIDFNLCGDAEGKSTDVAPVTCAYDPLPTAD
jgi:parallel beta-helix repeat protein